MNLSIFFNDRYYLLMRDEKRDFLLRLERRGERLASIRSGRRGRSVGCSLRGWFRKRLSLVRVISNWESFMVRNDFL